MENAPLEEMSRRLPAVLLLLYAPAATDLGIRGGITLTDRILVAQSLFCGIISKVRTISTLKIGS
jgi:hypothetical protein